jgi:acetoin utilization deacetylase AcuC-like enzyme
VPVPVFSHASCERHDPGAGHPEAPARLRAVRERLEREPAAVLLEAPAAPEAALRAVHDGRYLDQVRALVAAGGGALDADTVLNGHSWDAAVHAAGAALAATDRALDGGGNGFAAGRPPGHHALAGSAMGFCILANAVIAARHALARGRERVLIVDWDVHHGNGTQALVEADPAIRFVSMHQWPWWPGTGAAEERGVGNIFNVPRPPGLPPERYVEDLWSAILAATHGWTPGLVVVSAGFDAMRGDPLGGFTLEPGHYAALTLRLRELLPGAPLVGLLEGGYIPARLAEGVAAHVRALA